MRHLVRTGVPLVPWARIRVKLVVSAVLTVVAALVGLPGPTVLALAATTVAIPVAVGLVGGASLLRALVLPVAARGPDRCPEQDDHLAARAPLGG